MRVRTPGGPSVTTVAVVALAVSAGGAQAGGGLGKRLGLDVRGVVQGDDDPALTLQPEEPIERFEAELERDDGTTTTLRATGIAAGERVELPFEHPKGRHGYEATLEVAWKGGDETRSDIEFEATRVGELTLEIGPEDVDLESGRIGFRITNPAKRAELTLFDAEGSKLGRIEESWDGAPAGERLTLRWDPPDEAVGRAVLKVHDVAGFWKGVEIEPFSVRIPHDEVRFETGEHVIRDEETPKLEQARERIEKQLEAHGDLLSARLYVAGYTDTVGSESDNRELSRRRARAIAAWFDDNGLDIPIFYQGFGEEVLAEPTPDETAEAANRRALYILASQPPTGSAIPDDDWKEL